MKLGPSNTVPHPELTHLIMTDNIQLLREKLKERVPQGLIMINGGLLYVNYACIIISYLTIILMLC